MDIAIIFSRTILIYFTVFVVLRLMGKREIGKLSVFDLVISIMIAEIAVLVVEDAHKPLAEGLVPMGTLVLIQILFAFINLKNRRIRNLFDGSPSVIIENGKINREEMKKQNYNLDDLLLQLRQNNLTDLSKVEFAILETTGKLTAIKKEDDEKQNHPTLKSPSSKGTIRYEGLPLPLIMDGKVQDDNLQKINQTRFWLKNVVQEKGGSDFKDVFICTIDHKGKIYIDLKR